MRDNHSTKVPFIAAAGMRNAKSNDPTTWRPYADAVRFAPKFDGIGYALGDGWVGIDLDHCRDVATGAIAPWALVIVKLVDSYTEVSPSGTGLHILCRGTWPGTWNNRRGAVDGHKVGVEVYASGKYFTVTGDAIGEREIAERDAELAQLAAMAFAFDPPRLRAVVETRGSVGDKELLDRMFASANGEKIRRLWAGDAADFDGDESRADWDLIDHLLYWTDDDTLRVDRLFRASGLFRDKWDRRHFSDGATYGDGSISRRAALRRAKAGGYVRPATTQPPPGADEAITAAALQHLDLPKPRHIVEGYLPEGCVVEAGRSKVGKSWKALNVSAAVASGGVALGGLTVERGDVLYLALEDGRSRIQGRLQKQLGEATWPERLSIRTWMPNQTLPACWETLEAWVTASAHPVLLIVDTFQRIRPPSKKGVNIYQQDSEDLTPWQEFAKRHRLCVWVIHHTNKMKMEEGMDPFDAISGSTALPAVADAAIVFFRESRSQGTAYLRGRDIEEATYLMQWSDELMCWTLVGDAEQITLTKERREVLDLYDERQEVSVAQCADLLGLERSTARHRLLRMFRDGLLTRTKEGKYRVNVHAPPRTAPIDMVSPLSALSAYSGQGRTGRTPNSQGSLKNAPPDPQTRGGQADTADREDRADTNPPFVTNTAEGRAPKPMWDGHSRRCKACTGWLKGTEENHCRKCIEEGRDVFAEPV